jgi:hypothetical protein
MPPRFVVDCMINDLLDSESMALCAIHKGTFKKEYERFWSDPHLCSITWISLLFGLCCISINLRISTNTALPDFFALSAQREPRETLAIFREKVIQCLILGNYTDPTTYTVEALLTYVILDHFCTPDAVVGSWMVGGILVRQPQYFLCHRSAWYISSSGFIFLECPRLMRIILTLCRYEQPCDLVITEIPQTFPMYQYCKQKCNAESGL